MKYEIDYEFWLKCIDDKLLTNKKIIKRVLTIFSVEMILNLLQLILLVLIFVKF